MIFSILPKLGIFLSVEPELVDRIDSYGSKNNNRLKTYSGHPKPKNRLVKENDPSVSESGAQVEIRRGMVYNMCRP